jgi:hypothetical protein
MNGLGDKNLVCRLNGYRYKHENSRTGRKVVELLLSTLIVMYQLQVVLCSPLNKNSISGAKSTVARFASRNL